MTNQNNKKLPSVSFIIPTLNAAFILEKCLKAIRLQIYPQDKVEIVIADGGSSDRTIDIAHKYDAKVIHNPDILHEPGKSRASSIAKGEILFYTDADNILVGNNWIQNMVKPYIDNKDIWGLLPQTISPSDSSGINQYLSHLFTDPFTWFVYGHAANPLDYEKMYTPIKTASSYKVYKFNKRNHPLFGLSQGVGTSSQFKRTKEAFNDDLLAGLKLIAEGGLIAHVPHAGVYHYHINSFGDFIRKYSWRIRNNLTQKVKGMGFRNRSMHMSLFRKLRAVLFIPYALSVIFPILDSVYLFIKYRSKVMLWHGPITFFLGILMIYEFVKHILGIHSSASTAYGK